MDSTIWDGKRSIQLTLTDMRYSTWKLVPESGRHQINVELKEVEIFEDMVESSFNSLKDQVLKNVVQGSESLNRSSSFEIANPDFGRISKENVKTLKNHDCLILVDKNQQEFPFRYTQKYSTVPHTRSVTDQEGKFYGGEEHNPAAFALAELVDNALSATVLNKGKRLIEIHFFNQGTDKSSIHVIDNGCGMNSQTIQSSLKYKAPKESRNNQLAATTTSIVPSVSSPQPDGYEDAHPLHINSNISKFGAGMKQAVFWLGQEVTLMTKSTDSKNTCEVRLSQNKMEEREKEENKDPWQQKQYNGKPEELYNYKFWSSMHSEIVPQYKEKTEKSFTHISVEVIRHQGSPSPLNLLKLEDSKYEIAQSVEKQLSHIYHYYLHGRKSVDKNAAPGKESQLEIIVNRYDSSGNLTTSRKLRQLDDDSLDLEAQFVRTMTPNPFLFTIEVANYNGISSFNVGGIIRYHPFILDRETNPAGIVARKRNIAGLSGEGDGSSSSNSKEGGGESIVKSTEFFQVFWNGRLIPMTKLESFDFCSVGTRMKPGDKMYKSYGRLSGSLFLDSNIKEITDNKLNLTTTAELSKLFNEKTIGSHQSTFHRILPLASSSSSRKMQNKRGVGREDFVKWLKECQKYDKQVTYSGLVDTDNPPKKNFVKYKNASWEGVVLKEGFAIKLKNPDALGKVVGFWVERENRSEKEDPLDAPLGEVEIQLLPSSYYAQGNQQLSMHLIDLGCVNKKAEEQIKERTDALKMKLKILHWDQELRNGDERKIDELLVNGLVAFDVVNAQGVSVQSMLPYGDKGKGGKRSAKQIFMTSRVYRVYDNGVRLLYYNSAISKWDQTTDRKGFYFKDLNLAEMNMDEPGNFVIIFITYVKETNPVGTGTNIPAIEAPPTTTRGGGRGRGRPRRAVATPALEQSNLPEELDFAEYWKQEIDELGRKIFREDEGPSNSRKQGGPQLIRLPYLEINFRVTAGSPALLEIVTGGDRNPIKIGQAFDASVLIKDAKGNRILDEDTWNIIRAQRPNISVTLRSSSDMQFNVSSGRFVKDENSAAIIIKNIIISGYLDGDDSKECKLEVKVTLGENDLTNFVNITIYPGLPAKIESLNDPSQLSQIENSSRPKLSAHVLDASGNILQVNRKKKPIMLRAEFYRKCELTPVCQGNFICASQEDRTPQELIDTIIELPELKTGNITELNLICKIICDQDDSSLSPITTVLHVTVVPSTKPDKLKLYIKNGTKLTEIGENSDIQLSDCKISVQSNVEFVYKLWDGMGNEISFDESKWKIKINWPVRQYFNVPKFSIIVPNTVENKRQIVSKLLIPDLEKIVKHEFFMTTYPLNISRLKISWQADQPQATILSFPITTDEFPKLVAKFADQFDNLIKIEDWDEIKEEIVISTTPDLDIRPCHIYQGEENDEPNSFLIKFGLRAFNGGFPRETEVQLNVSFREIFHDSVRFNLVAGPPTEIALEIEGTLQSGRATCPLPNLSVVSIRAIFLDAAKNRTEANEDTKIILRFFPKANWYPQEDMPIREFFVKKKTGAAEFGSIIVGVSPSQVIPGPCTFQNKRCPGICFGKLTVAAETKLNGSPITARCEFHVKPRSNAPHKLDVSFQGSQFQYTAGSSFEGLSVTLEAEDGSTIVTAELNQLRLVLDETKSIYPTFVQEGTFIFGKVPEKAGNYTADFVYEVDGIVVVAKVEDGLTIVAGEVKEFGPVCELPEHISVSNDPNRPEARIISNELTLALKDEYGNSCNNSNWGVTFKSPVQLENHSQLVNKEYHFVNGKLKVPPLIIQPTTGLNNNSKHKLKFTATLKERSLIFELEFNFYDNAHQQEKIQLLTLSLGELNRSIRAMEDKIKEIRKEVEKYQTVFNAKIRAQEGLLRELGYQIDNPDVNTREHLLRTTKRRLLEQRTGAESNILPTPADNEPGVLGQIGLLAQIKSGSLSFQQDKELQRVLTWHLGKQLFVTVVQTKEKGLELRDKFPGKQFMLLDVIKDRPDLNWNEQRQVLRGPGNPIYARSILHIPNQTQTALIQKVFNVVLGNTIIVDTLELATAFMKEYNRRERGTCPTLLTRDGHRLSANGIIGGDFNTAPPLVENQRKLGIAQSSELERIEAELILISRFRAAMSETARAKHDFTEYAQGVASDLDKLLKDITAKKTEKQLKEDQLKSTREEYESQQPQISPTMMQQRQKPRTRSFTPCQQGPNIKRPRI